MKVLGAPYQQVRMGWGGSTAASETGGSRKQQPASEHGRRVGCVLGAGWVLSTVSISNRSPGRKRIEWPAMQDGTSPL